MGRTELTAQLVVDGIWIRCVCVCVFIYSALPTDPVP